MAARQTQNYLRGLFARRGIAPRHRLGQNFLIDLNIHELIVEEAQVGPGDVILEVGPGAGALTALMAARGARVVAVELDPAMAALAAEAVAGLPNARVVHADALANKNTLGPELIDAVDQALAAPRPAVTPADAEAAPASGSFKLVANLPYCVATPVIMNLLVHPRLRPERMLVTIQKELGERMIAAPSTPDYGALSAIVQALADVAIVRVLPPSVFWPRPKVESAVVSIRPDPARVAALDVPWLHDVVRKLFLHRRKNLRHVLSGLWRDGWSKAEVDAWLNDLGRDITGDLRAEALSPAQLRTLAAALKARWGDRGPADEGRDAADPE